MKLIIQNKKLNNNYIFFILIIIMPKQNNRNWKFDKNHRVDDRYKQKKREIKPKSEKNKRGNWSFSLWQQFVKRLKELHIKTEICQKGGFDINKIDKLMDPDYLSPIDRIELKLKNNNYDINKLTNKEKTILNVNTNRANKKKESDNKYLKSEGLSCKVKTNEGVKKKLLLALNKAINDENYELVYFITLKFKQKKFNIDGQLLLDNKDLLKKANKIIDKLDTIKLQFLKFFDEMPPLNETGFVDLEEFQKLAILAMRERRSFIIKAPTSSGKSIVTSYLASLKGIRKILIVVPTSALAWYLSALFSDNTGEDAPLVTRRFKSDPNFDKLVEYIKNYRVIVGTPSDLVDIIPIKEVWDSLINELDYVIFDEIHMMGETNSYKTNEMEILAKIFSKKEIQFAALSATIGNVDYLYEWFCKISEPGKQIEVLECNERFFNLESFYYKPGNGFIKIHPLAPITIDEFKDKSILNKKLYPVPVDIFRLYEKLKDFEFDLGELDVYKYFTKNQHIKLQDTYEWFNKLLLFMIDNCHNEAIELIINSYNIEDFDEYDPDLIELLYSLKKNKMMPAIIFSDTTETVLENAKNVSRLIKDKEKRENKNLEKQKIKQMKINSRLEKKKDKEINARGNFKDHDFGKKNLKSRQIENKNSTDQGGFSTVSLREPLKDYIFSNDLEFTEGEIDNIADDLKEYGFKTGNNDLHYVMDLLWRSIGIYCTGMPEDWLRLIQMLASKKKVVVVFSDDELVYGVSMPWRTVVVLRDDNYPYQVSIAKDQQRVGRAGRRGLDKRGNNVYVGQSSNEIKRLTTGSVANIGNVDNRIYSLNHAILLSENETLWNNLIKNNFSKNISDEKSIAFYDIIKKNLFGNDNELGSWHFAIDTNQTAKENLDRANYLYDSCKNNININKNRLDKLKNEKKTKKTKKKFVKLKNTLKELNISMEYYKKQKAQSLKLFNDGKMKAMHFNHLMHKWRSVPNEKDWVRLAYIIPSINSIYREVDIRDENNQISLANFLLHFINTKVSEGKDLPDNSLLNMEPYIRLKSNLSELDLEVPDKIDGTLFFSIRENRLIEEIVDGQVSFEKTYQLRNKLLELIELIIPIQNYYYEIKNEVNITRLFGKLLTRMKWIYVNSNPIMKHDNYNVNLNSEYTATFSLRRNTNSSISKNEISIDI